MSTAHIPPGREDLYRRQAASDKELQRHADLTVSATHRREALVASFGWDNPIVEDADNEMAQRLDEYNRVLEINDRIYEERTAGLSSWIDHDPTAPVCTGCGGAGCKACRGWGREYREPIPVWDDRDKQWVNPATGRTVDLLADPPVSKPTPAPEQTPKRPDLHDQRRGYDTNPITTTGSTAGGAGMSRILEGQQFLLNAAREFDDLAPNVNGCGEPEEIGQLLQAGQLEDEAEQLLAQASGATTAKQAAALAQQAEQLFLQAEGLRQQVEQGLMGRAGNASTNAETAAGARNQIMEAAAGTATGDELVATASAIHAAIDESGTRLAGAASMATARDQTEPCLGLIKEAQEQCAAAAGMCGQLSRDLTEYAGRL